MKQRDESIPLAPSMGSVGDRRTITPASGVNRRIVFLTVQAVINAFIIGLIAKVLVCLIELITNLAFYGRFSIRPVSPADNHLGVAVIVIPIIGSILVGLMARFGSKA